MSHVSIRELRNNGGEVVNRAAGGETITITKSGTPVATLRGLPSRRLTATALLERWRHLPTVDQERLRHDIDEVVDQSL